MRKYISVLYENISMSKEKIKQINKYSFIDMWYVHIIQLHNQFLSLMWYLGMSRLLLIFFLMKFVMIWRVCLMVNFQSTKLVPALQSKEIHLLHVAEDKGQSNWNRDFNSMCQWVIHSLCDSIFCENFPKYIKINYNFMRLFNLFGTHNQNNP